MKLEYVEDLIDREHINLIDAYLSNSEAAFVSYDKLNMILYDTSKIKTSTRKKEIFAEELRTLLLFSYI